MKLTALLLLVSLGLTAAIDCRTNEIACSNGSNCIPQRYLCDFDRDCTDASDEDEELCIAWGNDRCGNSLTECTRNGTSICIEISEYCSHENPGCEGSLDRRICLMLESQRLDKLNNFILPTEAPAAINCSEGQIACSNSEKCIPQQYICDGGNDCADASDEDEELCRMLKSKRLDNPRYISLPLPPNPPNPGSCPPLYTLAGDQCLLVYSTGYQMGWAEARTICKVLGGDLWTFKNISQFADTVQYLQKYELLSSFWIGGSVSDDDTEGWTWIDGSPMQMGTPFWATRYSTECVNRNVTTDRQDPSCIHYYQSPEGLPLGACASLSHEHSFYIADEDCLRKMAPLCVY